MRAYYCLPVSTPPACPVKSEFNFQLACARRRTGQRTSLPIEPGELLPDAQALHRCLYGVTQINQDRRDQFTIAPASEEYEPIVEDLRRTGLGGEGTDAERYLRVAMLRFMLLHTHDWDEAITERLSAQVRPPQTDDDTLVHQILDEMR